MSSRVTAFKAFLKENQTGLVQQSSAWVKARKHTIGASEMAVLTRASPFDTPASLVRKKLHPPDLSQNVPKIPSIYQYGGPPRLLQKRPCLYFLK